MKVFAELGTDPGSRHAITTRMTRNMSEDEYADYKKKPGTEQAEIRLKYIQSAVGTFFEEAVHEESWKRVDVSKGAHMS